MSVDTSLKGDLSQKLVAFLWLAFPTVHEMPIVERKFFSWDREYLAIVESPNRDVIRFELEHFRNDR